MMVFSMCYFYMYHQNRQPLRKQCHIVRAQVVYFIAVQNLQIFTHFNSCCYYNPTSLSTKTHRRHVFFSSFPFLLFSPPPPHFLLCSPPQRVLLSFPLLSLPSAFLIALLCSFSSSLLSTHRTTPEVALGRLPRLLFLRTLKPLSFFYTNMCCPWDELGKL